MSTDVEKDAEIHRLREELRRAQSEMDDVLDSTKDIEAQLEQEIAQTEKQLIQLRRKNEDLALNAQNWKEKLLNAQAMHDQETTALRREVQTTTAACNKAKAQLRDEELKHDDLERHERIVNSSYEDLERKYHGLLERNAELESDLQTKEELEIQCQRLKDEMRDANLELLVLRTSNESDSHTLLEKSSVSEVDKSSPSGSDYSHKKESFYVHGVASSPDITQRNINRSESMKNMRTLTTSMQLLREKMQKAVHAQVQMRPELARRMSSAFEPDMSPIRPASRTDKRPPSSLGSYQRPSSSSSDRPTSATGIRFPTSIPRSSLGTSVPARAMTERPPSRASEMRPPSSVSRPSSSHQHTTSPTKLERNRRASGIPSPLIRPSSTLSDALQKPVSVATPIQRRMSNFHSSSPTPGSRISTLQQKLQPASSSPKTPLRRSSFLPGQ